ncbi:MAG: AtpZ/AtpI family protein [Bacteroidia bacterium]|nr:AtpZ/AtpI family protein [Bacteroidia bacterium]
MRFTPKRKPKPSDSWRRALSVGIEIVAIMGLWTLIGYLVERYLGFSPYGLLIAALGGVAHVLWVILRL